jgi:peptidoglycan/xylan/chitin deacetylase (PgdA/CDA1 family)
MITKNKYKYVIIIFLLIAWAGGLFGFLQVEKYVVLSAQGTTASFINPVIGVTRQVSIPVLLYHGIVEKEDGSNITIPAFKEQMTALKKSGYTAISTHDLLAFYKQGAKLPPKPVVITFDDGRRDSYLNGDAVLKELGFKAVMFVVTGREDSADNFFLSWDELLQMHKSGRWDIEAHSYNGHDLMQIDDAGNTGNFYSNKMWLSEQDRLESDEEYQHRVLDDLQTAKSDLENHIEGIKVISFAFPFGDYGQKGVNIPKETAEKTYLDAVKATYQLSFELNFTGSDFNNFEDSDTSLLRRFEVPNGLSANDLIEKLTKSRLKTLPYAVLGFTPKELSNWFCNWGKVDSDDISAKLTSDENESGSEIMLYGGHYWKDYSFHTEISIEAGCANFIGRYVDDNNFVFCGISGNGVLIGQKVRGQYFTLNYHDLGKSKNEYIIDLEFSGDTVACKVDDQPIFGPTPIDPGLARGGVGFQVWNAENTFAQISVREVIVSSNQLSNTNTYQAGLIPWMTDIAANQ